MTEKIECQQNVKSESPHYIRGMNLKDKQWNLFLPAIVLLLIYSLFVSGEARDYHLHDTYFVVGMDHAAWAGAIILGLMYILYRIVSGILKTRFLSWAHVVATLAIFLVIFYFDRILLLIYSRQYSYVFADLENRRVRPVLIAIGLFIIVSQLLLIVNIVLGLIRKFT